MRPKTSGVTSEIKIKRCYGCGAILQSNNKREAGYIDKEHLESSEEHLCQRCYRLRHYNEDNQVPAFNEDFHKILQRAKEKEALIVWVLDTFSLCGSLEEGMITSLNELQISKVFVILNKRDVLPKSFNEEKILAHTKSVLAKSGITPLETLIISSLKNYNLDDVMSTIERLRGGKDVYFMGVSQVGKSSIINCLLKNYQNKTDKLITTSSFPGTTIDVIKIPLDKNSYIYDTAGIFNSRSMINNVERNILKYIIPRNEINLRTYQVKEEQSFLLGTLAKIDFVKGPNTNFTIVCANTVDVQRTKLAKSNATFNSFVVTKETKPVSTLITDIKDLKQNHFELPNSGSVAIQIAGFAVIILEANNQVIDVYAPSKVLVNLGSNPWY